MLENSNNQEEGVISDASELKTLQDELNILNYQNLKMRNTQREK